MSTHLANLVELVDVVADLDKPLLDGDFFDALANVGQVKGDHL